MHALSDPEKDEYLRVHLRHRLTLLRTLRKRKKAGYDYSQQGDIYRCVKDSNLIALRLLLDFLGLKATATGSAVTLSCNPRRFAADVKVDQFINRLLTPGDVPDAGRQGAGSSDNAL